MLPQGDGRWRRHKAPSFGSYAPQPASPGCGRDLGRRAALHDVLGPIYGWFTPRRPERRQGAARPGGMIRNVQPLGLSIERARSIG